MSLNSQDVRAVFRAAVLTRSEAVCYQLVSKVYSNSLLAQDALVEKIMQGLVEWTLTAMIRPTWRACTGRENDAQIRDRMSPMSDNPERLLLGAQIGITAVPARKAARRLRAPMSVIPTDDVDPKSCCPFK